MYHMTIGVKGMNNDMTINVKYMNKKYDNKCEIYGTHEKKCYNNMKLLYV